MARGLLTRGQLRSKAWRPIFRDVYADAQLTVSHRTRCQAAARWLLPPGAAIAGRSAAALFGAGFIADADPLDVLVPAGQRFGPVAGLAVHTAEVDGFEVLSHDGMPVTTPLRTCWDLAQWLDQAEAVVVVDRLLGRRLVRIEQLLDLAHDRRGARGWKRMLRVAELADPGAESAPESRLRVRIVLAGLPGRSPSSWCNGTVVSSPGSTWPGRTCGSRSSTTASGMTTRRSSTATDVASTACSARTGSCCT